MMYKKMFRQLYLAGTQNRRISAVLLFFAMMIFPFMYGYLKATVFIIFFVITNLVLSVVLKPFKKFPHGFEIVSFSTVLIGVAFGGKLALFFGMIQILLNYIITKRISYYIICFIPTYGLIGYLASLGKGMDIVFLGTSLSLLYSILSSLLVFFFFRAKITKCFFFIATHTICNHFLFTSLGVFFLSIMV